MSHHPDSLWGIITRAMKDIEGLNNFKFGNESWKIIKRMDSEICAWERRVNAHLNGADDIQTYRALTDVQRHLLTTSSGIGTTILKGEEIKLREARELEAEGYITLTYPERANHYWNCNITIKGRKLLQANGAVL